MPAPSKPGQHSKGLLTVGRNPETTWLVYGIFTLIIGIPAGLFAYRGRWDLAFGLIALFLAMVLATAIVFRRAVSATREAHEQIEANDDGEP